MKRVAVIAAILGLILVASSILTPVAFAAAPPPLIKRPMDFLEYTIEGGSPETVDYSWAYDTASGNLIMNTMDTLIMFNGEHTDQYVPGIATSWKIEPLNGGLGIAGPDSITGLSFENDAQPGPTQTWYWRYTFEIRPSVFFQPPWNYSLTPEDVAYSFQRTMLQDRSAGPQWMIQEPLLDFNYDSFWYLGDLTDPAIVARIGALVRDSVGYNATHVWLNLMFPGAYAPLMQILCQTCSSITSKQWINNQVITAAGRPDWNGDWSSLTAWNNTHNPTISPLDSPTPMEYGSGPYILTNLDYNAKEFTLARYEDYWGGWPSTWPLLGPVAPAGYVDTIEVSWALLWGDRKAAFLAGDCDFCAIPGPATYPEMYVGGPPYDPPNYPLDGIRVIHPLPELAVDGCFFTFSITQGANTGTLGPAGTFDETWIPTDFFGNAVWGVKVRKAFAYAFDYATYLSTVFLGEAVTPTPATAIIPGLSYYDPTVVGPSYNLLAANASFNAVPSLSTTGFTINLVYDTGNEPGYEACVLLKQAIESLNPRYHCTIVSIEWRPYLIQAIYNQLPFFTMGIKQFVGCSPLVYYTDPQSAAFPFYHTGGAFASWQAYSNATMDALIGQAINTPDGPARAALYKQIQQGAVDDCPSFITAQPVGRHFERDWVCGWHYNVLRQGDYFYNLWKWYYVPEQLDLVPSQPHGYNLPADVTYDGKVDIKDISTVAKAFGASYGPPINPRWVFRADINNDRKVDIKDISYVAKLFGKVCPSGPWPLSTVTITSSPPTTSPPIPPNIIGDVTIHVGNSITFTMTVTLPSPATITINRIDWINNGNPVPSAHSTVWTFTPLTPGVYNIKVDVFETITSPGWWYSGPVSSSEASHEIEVIVLP
jgi:peptide/nickel transport system substrate-binding protein